MRSVLLTVLSLLFFVSLSARASTILCEALALGGFVPEKIAFEATEMWGEAFQHAKGNKIEVPDSLRFAEWMKWELQSAQLALKNARKNETNFARKEYLELRAERVAKILKNFEALDPSRPVTYGELHALSYEYIWATSNLLKYKSVAEYKKDGVTYRLDLVQSISLPMTEHPFAMFVPIDRPLTIRELNDLSPFPVQYLRVFRVMRSGEKVENPATKVEYDSSLELFQADAARGRAMSGALDYEATLAKIDLMQQDPEASIADGFISAVRKRVELYSKFREFVDRQADPQTRTELDRIWHFVIRERGTQMRVKEIQKFLDENIVEQPGIEHTSVKLFDDFMESLPR